MEELIALAKAIRATRSRGEETGLSDEEIAFYDALADNESTRTATGEPALQVIAHELVVSVRGQHLGGLDAAGQRAGRVTFGAGTSLAKPA